MRPGSEDHARWLEAEIARMQRRLDRIPARWRDVQVRYLRVGDGNELIAAASPVLGLKTLDIGSPITSVPTAEPTMGTTYADGLTAATDLDTEETVWLASCAQESGGTARQDLTGALPEGVPVWCYRSCAIPISGGGGATATVWLPWRV